jgi:hypothetical protein
VAPSAVYNLTLERDNAYYANGILVFNCLTFATPFAFTAFQGNTVGATRKRGRPNSRSGY